MTVCNKFQTNSLQDRGSDAVLWARMRAGSNEALARLYEAYLPSLEKHGGYVCNDPELVRDSIHELFSKLWTRRKHICEASNVKVYLYRSLERIIVAQLLRSKKRSTYTTAEDLASDSFEQLLIEGELRKQRLSEIKKCLQSLPKCQREVILLKFFNDLTYPEISEIMNLQIASVYNLASKAIEHLRQKMQLQAFVAL